LTGSISINEFSCWATTSQTYTSKGDWQLTPFKITPRDNSKNWIDPIKIIILYG
jgi:hypothetical protein